MTDVIVSTGEDTVPDPADESAHAAAVAEGAAAAHGAQAAADAQAAGDAAAAADSAAGASTEAAMVAEESAAAATDAAAGVGALIEAHTAAVREQTAAIQSLVEQFGSIRTSQAPEPPVNEKTTTKRADREPRQRKGGRARGWYYGNR